jgi:hypothetical protein
MDRANLVEGSGIMFVQGALHCGEVDILTVPYRVPVVIEQSVRLLI